MPGCCDCSSSLRSRRPRPGLRRRRISRHRRGPRPDQARRPLRQGLRFDLWAHDLIESARNRVLSDVAWNNGTWQGPWWLLHGLASIGSYGLGGHAAQQAAEAAKSLPRAVLAQQPDWLALMPDIEATGDVHVLRDVYGTRFGVIAGFAYPGGVDPSVYLLGFDASEYLSLAAAGVFDDAEPAVAAWREQVGDSTPGAEPVTPQVLAWLSHAEHSEGLVSGEPLGRISWKAMVAMPFSAARQAFADELTSSAGVEETTQIRASLDGSLIEAVQPDPARREDWPGPCFSDAGRAGRRRRCPGYRAAGRCAARPRAARS